MMKISTQTHAAVFAFGEMEGVRGLIDAGYDCLDFSFFGELDCARTADSPVWDVAYNEKAKELRAYAESRGVTFNQAHAPFPSSKGDPEEDAKIFDAIVRSMEVASILGVKHIIVHPKQHLTYAANAQELFEQNVAFYKELIPHAERLNVRICTENMWQYDSLRGCIVPSVCADPKEFCALIDAVDSPYLAACLDVGHCALTGYDIPAFIRTLGKDRLKALHIHDVDYRSDNHTLAFQQKLPWEEIMAALAEIGYEGDLTFEANNFVKNLPDALLEPACTFMAQTGHYLISRIEKNK